MSTFVSLPNTLLSPDQSRVRPSSFIATRSLRYANNREQLIINATTKAVEKLKSLPPREKEGYASRFNQLALKLL
jgi:membrane-bound lytic murein transglycosylase B